MHRFETDNINLAAYLVTSSEKLFTAYSAQTGKVIFHFADTPKLRDLIVAYETGATIPAKALLLTRTRLYHEAGRISGRGRL